MRKDIEELVEKLLAGELSDFGKKKLAKYIREYDFDKVIDLKLEIEKLKAKIFVYEEEIKRLKINRR